MDAEKIEPTDGVNPLEVRSESRDALATDRDTRARGRDDAAEARDVRASFRDRDVRTTTDDQDRAFPGRLLSAGDRDDAAGDRADALLDRDESRRDRELAASDRADHLLEAGDGVQFQQALEDRGIIGQAQGLLMAEMGLTAAEAFEVLRLESTSRSATMRDVAAERIQATGRLLTDDG